LVEVSSSFSDDDILRPIAMGASKDFPFPSRVLLVSKHDWMRVNAKDIALPHGWDLAALKEL
jgi:hypothetical protein